MKLQCRRCDSMRHAGHCDHRGQWYCEECWMDTVGEKRFCARCRKQLSEGWVDKQDMRWYCTGCWEVYENASGSSESSSRSRSRTPRKALHPQRSVSANCMRERTMHQPLIRRDDPNPTQDIPPRSAGYRPSGMRQEMVLQGDYQPQLRDPRHEMRPQIQEGYQSQVMQHEMRPPILEVYQSQVMQHEMRPPIREVYQSQVMQHEMRPQIIQEVYQPPVRQMEVCHPQIQEIYQPQTIQEVCPAQVDLRPRIEYGVQPGGMNQAQMSTECMLNAYQAPAEAIYTTLMLRHLPNKYSREMMLQEFAARGVLLDIDFFYLPIDLRHKHNVGYCFVNLTSGEGVIRFRQAFNGLKLGLSMRSDKTCEVGVAKIQGLIANIEAYRNCQVMSTAVHRDYQPLLLQNGVPIPFPTPTMSLDDLRQIKKGKSGVSSRRPKTKKKDGPEVGIDTMGMGIETMSMGIDMSMGGVSMGAMGMGMGMGAMGMGIGMGIAGLSLAPPPRKRPNPHAKRSVTITNEVYPLDVYPS